MSEKQHIESILKKVQEEHPEVTDSNEINRLAILEDTKKTRKEAILYIVFAVVLAVVGILVNGETGGIALVGAIYMVVEFFLTLRKLKKIPQRYGAAVQSTVQGPVTMELLMRDCQKKLKKAESFQIHLLPLEDKSDENDGYGAVIDHKYYLTFKLPNAVREQSVKVNERVYFEAVLKEPYYVAVCDGVPCAAYSAKERSLAPDLLTFLVSDCVGTPQ